MSKFQYFISTANKQELRRLGEEIGIVNDDKSFDELLKFLQELILKS